MDSIKCEAFLTAAEHGSLTVAGALLGYTQPGITRMIRSLETECGFTLLTRTVKGVEATENGKTLMPYFRDIVRAQKSVEEASRDIQGIHRGVLTIGSYYSVSAMILPSVFQKFRSRYPDIQLKLYEGGNQDMARRLTEKSIDCCFAAKQSDKIKCEWFPVLEDELVIWLPPDHERAYDSVYPVQALNGEPFIITMPNQDTDTDINRLLDKYHIKPDIRLSTADAYTTWKMVEAGIGVSLNQRLIYQGWKGNVVALPFDPPQKIEMGISVPSMKEASPAVKKFIHFVFDVCK